MQINDQPKLAEMLEELCSIYSKPCSEALVSGYYRVLKPYSFNAIYQATMRLLGDSDRKQLMPLPAEIRALAPRFERAESPDLDEERWRRRYDVWQTGRFSDESLAVANMASDHELGLDQPDGEEYTCLRCQQPGCRNTIPWPPVSTGEGRMFCPGHQPSQADPVTAAEKTQILSRLTPAAKSFLRSIPEVAHHMLRISVTPEEQAITDEAAIVRRAVAFEETAEGPGVNPSVFLNHPHLAGDLPSEYAERRHIMASAGWKYEPGVGQWTKGWRVMTDEEIDRFPDGRMLHDYVRR